MGPWREETRREHVFSLSLDLRVNHTCCANCLKSDETRTPFQRRNFTKTLYNVKFGKTFEQKTVLQNNRSARGIFWNFQQLLFCEFFGFTASRISYFWLKGTRTAPPPAACYQNAGSDPNSKATVVAIFLDLLLIENCKDFLIQPIIQCWQKFMQHFCYLRET